MVMFLREEAITAAGCQPGTAAGLLPWGRRLHELSIQTGHGEGPEGEAGVVLAI
jgi:hypothetical protein